MSSLYNSSPARSEKNNIVTIDMTHHPPNAKLGMLLAPGALPTPIISDRNNATNSASAAASSATSSNVTLVAGWEHGNNQQLGPIQRSGQVRLGDRLVRINGRDVTDWTFREVMDVLKEMISTKYKTSSSLDSTKRKRRLKSLGFAPSGTEEWSQGIILGGEEFNSTSMLFGLFQSQESKVSPHVISKRLYSFVSFVGHQWRVVDEPIISTATEAAKVSKITNASPQVISTKPDTVKEEEEKKDQLQQHQQDQQLRQISENSTDLLEEQLNKEPSMKFDGDGPIDITDDDDENNIDEINQDKQSPNKAATATATQAPPSIFSPEAEAEWHKEITEFQENNRPQKKIVQYEIQCHLLLRDPNNSFKSNKSSTHGNKKDNVHHHSWSVWKRFSEFQSLDTELRNTFGWQMDAIDDGVGIVFPGVHGLESWWYGVRNGGGYLTSLMGGSYGVDVADADARADEEDNNNNNNKKNDNKTGTEGGGSASLFGFVSNNTPTETAAAASTTANGNTDDDSNNKNASISSTTTTSTTSTTCPYPKPFIEKRQKELGSYWISLSRVEDIFEFSDVNSHRFGRLMASFLEVDQVLLSKRNTRAITAVTASSQQRYHQPMTPSRLAVPVIHENETELFSFGARKSESQLSPLTPTREFSGMTFNDDDVSMLSDGTGANAYLSSLLQNNLSPRRLLVDNVPEQFNPPPLAAENRSVSSKSSKRVGGRGASQRTKPAFQRQFIDS